MNLPRSFNHWLCTFILLFLSPMITFGQSDGLPRGCNLMPYTRYEASRDTMGGDAQLHKNTDFEQVNTTSEASDQEYVGLFSNGTYVQWTINEVADGITLRFTLPDTDDGTGVNGSLNVYVNGSFIKTVDLTSYWAWQYFPGTEPSNTPGARPRMRFDEVHFKLDSKIYPGDVLKIQKDNGDSYEYGIDFIEIEEVPEPLSKPAGYVSVTDYGAVANDDASDLDAFYAALEAANNAGTGMYIPEGRFVLDDAWHVQEVADISILGAGIWYSEIHFSVKKVWGGINAWADNIEIAHLYLSTALNERAIDGSQAIYKGLMGTYGANSKIHDMWITHFECGTWIGGYDQYPIPVTSGLQYYNNRVRNNYADGINLCQGTNTSVVYQCSFRSNGDDAMAVWPNNYMGAPEGHSNIFKYNTVENNYRAAGAAIFGGYGHQIHHCIIKDGFAGSGIRFTLDFNGYHFENNTEIRIYECTIENCGTSKDLWDGERGSIELYGADIHHLFFENIDILNSQRHAIQLGGGHDLFFSHINIDGTGLDNYTASRFTIPLEGCAIDQHSSGTGSATFNNLTLNNIERDPPIYQSAPDGYAITINELDVPVTGMQLSKRSMDMFAGETADLTVSYTPANTTARGAAWTSSNSAIATYDETNERVIAHSTGTAVLTATSTTDSAISAACIVNVTASVKIVANDDRADEGGDTGQFTISLSDVSSDVVVNYTIGGTASSDDFTSSPELSGSITLTASNTSQTITITPLDDSEFEGTETIVINLQSGTGYQLGANTSATISITDNDNAPCTPPNIGLTSVAPVIDENIDAVWSEAGAVSISNVTLGALPGDFRGRYKAMYDNAKLYILVQATDNALNNDSGSQWWNDDVVNIFLDGDNSKNSSYDGRNDFQLGFRWNDENIHAGDNSLKHTTGISFSMFATTDGYALEAAIPWTTIGVTPVVGNQIGIDVQIDDDDDGGTRDAQLAAFSTTEMAWSDPGLFGTAYLTTCGDVIANERGYYDAPYRRYESESGTYANGAVKEGPTYDMASLAAEASDRQFVSLPSNGAYVQWTATEAANGITLRFSIPDGTQGSLALYVNAVKRQDLTLTSKWAWQYFNISLSTDGIPYNVPTGDNPQPRMRFDEIHAMVEGGIKAGDLVKIQNDRNDAFAYGIDFIELETVPGAVSMPSGYISVTDYGATPDDETNDAAEFEACLAAAAASGSNVYIPAGRFIIGTGEGSGNGRLVLGEYTDMTIKGAGMWYTELYFSNPNPDGAGIIANSSNMHLEDFYMNSATTGRVAGNKGISGSYGIHSTFTNLWIEHFEVGIWITPMPNAYKPTDGLVIRHCRIRNVYADGVNLAKGTSNSIVEHTSFRNCIDDAMATWSVAGETGANQQCSGNIFRYNTAENTLRAGGVGFFGGCGHEAHHLLIKDNFAGPGIRLNTQFPAFPFCTAEDIHIHDVTVIGAGTSQTLWTHRAGAINLYATQPTSGTGYDLTNAVFENIDVYDSQRDAVFIYNVNNSPYTIDNIKFNNLTIDGTGVAGDVNNGAPNDPTQAIDWEYKGYGIRVEGGATGDAIISGVSFANIADENYINLDESTFDLIFTDMTHPTSVSVAPVSLTLNVGQTGKITATINPSNATNQNVSWISSNALAATVTAGGLVTAVGEGKATITATTEDGGYTAACTVTVTAGSGWTYYRIRNRWQDTYLYDGGDIVRCSTLPTDAGLEYEWIMEDLGNGHFELRNAGTSDYMHIENLSGQIQCTSRISGWESSRWSTKKAESDYVRLQNVWQPFQYIHIENLLGYAQHGSIYSEWRSAQWALEAIPKSACLR